MINFKYIFQLINNLVTTIINIILGDEFKDIFYNSGINNVIILGSLSKDDFSVESDIDIAIIKKEKFCIVMNKERLKKLIYDLDTTTKELDKSIELVKKYKAEEEIKNDCHVH